MLEPARSHLLPPPARNALWRLGAPPDLVCLDDGLDWAMHHLHVTMTCRSGDPADRGIRHRIRIDPAANRAVHAPATRAEATRVEKTHFLWALGMTPPTCARIVPTLTRWVGTNPPRHRVWAESRTPEMLAVRTLMRLVTYTAAGHDPRQHTRWLSIGATAENLTHLHHRLRAHDLDPREVDNRLFSHVRHYVGYPGQPGIITDPTPRDLNDAIDTWIAHHAHEQRRAPRTAVGRYALA